MEILKCENVSKIYGSGDTEVRALDNVSFSIEKGEFVSIIGPSGSGKSTLLHILGGVDKPTEGKVIIDGTDIHSLNEDKLAIFRRRQIGLIYQFYNLMPVLNIDENIALPHLLDGRPLDKERLDMIVEHLGLTDRRNNLPNQLSGGQQQRVSIGRALYTHPAILPLDCKEIQPVHPKGDQSWVFIGRTDAKAETLNTLATSCEELTHWKRP